MALSIAQIRENLFTCLEKLQVIVKDPNYQAMQNSPDFTTNNDLVLGDGVLAIKEVLEALEDFEN
ncbi:hypothetical protein VB713_11860 [Anabaena cylindrica UHCC 0172]|uniref:hypothetical protein n=1 Tax=Anabaena cylindrica TaxID=1165 RepID=UPI002B208627|nr:hypothetical protein [Anabaena cylindrica]MEA5551665.1 hypothetical protein [Anabaena cylindrica UHCC 0172]